MLQDRAKGFSTVAIQVAVGHVEALNGRVRFEDGHEDHEVVAANVVLTNVQIPDSVRVLESKSEVFKTKTIVEEFVECSLLQLVLVAKFDLKHAPLIDICEANHVLGEVNMRERGIVFEYLRQNKQVL